MQVTKMSFIPDQHHTSFKGDLAHPATLQDQTHLHDEKLMVALTVQPPCSESTTHITMSVFIDGEQFVVFNGSAQEAREYFKKFPKN